MNTDNSINVKDYDILKAKIEWIQTCYLQLLQLIKSVGQYKEDWCTGEEKFAEYMRPLNDEIFCELLRIYESLDKNCDPDHSALAEIETDIKRLSSPSYEAPSEVDAILKDLGFLWAYWETCRHSKTYLANLLAGVPEAGLDMALVKLSKNIGGWEVSAMFYADRILSRTTKSTYGHRKEMKKRAQLVKEMFFRLKFPPKTKLNKVAKMILEELHPKPSLDTIKKYLLSDPETGQFFRKEGKFWVYESVTLSQ